MFLLAVVGWVVLPQVGNLPLWCTLLAAGVLCWRGWLAWGARPLPGKRWLVLLLVLATGATLLSHRTVVGRDAGVTLIVVLLALKTLELRARRDALVIFFLGFFTMLTNFFFSQSLLTAAAMLIALLGLLTALVNAHMPVGRPPLAQAAKTAATMAVLGAPIMLVLFMLFPRLAPLWGLPNDAMSGRSGLSAQMQVGNIAKLALDDSVAMRIRFDGTAPPSSQLYFRGPVLSEFDGREWRPARAVSDDPTNVLQLLGAPLDYQVTLEPNQRPWLIVLDATSEPPQIRGFEVRRNADLQWFVNRPITDIVRYSARSHPQYRYGPRERTVPLRDFVDLPTGFNPRTLQWAAELRRDPRYAQDEGAALIPAVLAHLANGEYTYTLEPGLYGRNTADEFWFDRKQGFCEHIASSFVLLMRALDLPARVVTGYQGAERNAVDGYWTVRNSDAHAWAEVWMPERGWIRVDPTAAVAPNRVADMTRLRAPEGAVAGLFASVSPGFAVQLRAAWDALNNGWNQWVLNYTQSRQLDLLRRLGFTSPSWEDLGRVLLAVVVIAALAASAWAMWERQQHDPWLRLLDKVRRRLLAAGVLAPDNAPPRELAVRLGQLPGGHSARGVQSLQALLLQLEAQRYAPGGGRGPGLAKLKRAFAGFDWSLLPARSTVNPAISSVSGFFHRR